MHKYICLKFRLKFHINIYYSAFWLTLPYSLSIRLNDQHFEDNIFNAIFLKENVWISIKILLQYVPVDNQPETNADQIDDTI